MRINARLIGAGIFFTIGAFYLLGTIYRIFEPNDHLDHPFYYSGFIIASFAMFCFGGYLVHLNRKREVSEVPDENKDKLKLAQEAYTSSLKDFKKGRISKEELKGRLRPYKYELRELGYPVKIKDDERVKEGGDVIERR